jgi:fructoselysine 6-phosphate deglycase
LGPGTTVVFNSWSGRNADVLDALAYARSTGAPTVAIVANPTSALAQGVDEVVLYTGRSIYEVPVLAVIELARAVAEPAAVALLDASVRQLPSRLRALLPLAAARARTDASRFASTDLFYILGAGPCSSLALKYANVFMENIRLGAAYYDAVEFRHGAVEALSRLAPAMVFLLGEDESRSSTVALADFCAHEGAVVLRYDAADYALGHPMLGPLVMNSFLQWFVVYSALIREIPDLDERVYMGTGRLSEGGWP